MGKNLSQLNQTVKTEVTRAVRDRQQLREVNLRLERERTRVDSAISTGTGAIPKRVTITSADSPYTPQDNTFVICDMSTGSITITLPTSSTYPISIMRSGASNTLTVTAPSGKTVNGDSSLIILYDKSCATLRYDGSDWKIT
jgi:hypothetical protein